MAQSIIHLPLLLRPKRDKSCQCAAQTYNLSAQTQLRDATSLRMLSSGMQPLCACAKQGCTQKHSQVVDRADRFKQKFNVYFIFVQLSSVEFYKDFF